MEKIANDTLSLWREEGSEIIQHHFDVFRSLVKQTKDLTQRGNYDMAAVYASIAAFYATVQHSGMFVSPELEQILLEIGRKTIPSKTYPLKSTAPPEVPKNILHVTTSVQAIGGLSKMLWRWIQQDTESCHSLVLTRQPQIEVPKNLKDAVINSGGQIYRLNETIGSLISWAKQLQKISTTADIVVLHIYNYDVIPIIAFANKEQSPPIIFLDHADHIFWLGVAISDIVVNLRQSGMRLSQERRGIKPERNMLLPTILEPINREYSRVDAKKQIGLPENSIVLLSIARAIKYKTVDGVTFADAHVPLLERYQEAILIVIGPGDQEDWSTAINKTQGRIRVFAEREDTAIFYQAADIYVDSFPFISTTSLLEAGSYGVPLVSRFPYSEASGILGSVMPGLDGNLLIARNLQDYTKILSNLVENQQYRISLGDATRQKIVDKHVGSNWQVFLENIYRNAMSVTKSTRSLPPIDEMFIGEPDIFIPFVHGGNQNLDLDWMIQASLPTIPFPQRLRYWIKSLKKYGFRNRFAFLLPEWFIVRYYSRLRSFLPF